MALVLHYHIRQETFNSLGMNYIELRMMFSFYLLLITQKCARMLTSKVRWISSSEHSSIALPVTTPALLTKIVTYLIDLLVCGKLKQRLYLYPYFTDIFFYTLCCSVNIFTLCQVNLISKNLSFRQLDQSCCFFIRYYGLKFKKKNKI